MNGSVLSSSCASRPASAAGATTTSGSSISGRHSQLFGIENCGSTTIAASRSPAPTRRHNSIELPGATNTRELGIRGVQPAQHRRQHAGQCRDEDAEAQLAERCAVLRDARACRARRAARGVRGRAAPTGRLARPHAPRPACDPATPMSCSERLERAAVAARRRSSRRAASAHRADRPRRRSRAGSAVSGAPGTWPPSTPRYAITPPWTHASSPSPRRRRLRRRATTRLNEDRRT